MYKFRYAELGIDRNQLVLIGDSAGGNLSTVLCQRALRQGKHHLIKVILIK